MRPETRHDAPYGPSMGPSWMRRRSATVPSLTPSRSATLRPSNSLRRMAGPRNAADDLPIHPFAETLDVQVVGRVEDHGRRHVGDAAGGDGVGFWSGLRTQSPV